MSNIRQLVSAARSRILLICPDCGHEHMEFADKLRGARFFDCIGDECGYRFDLFAGPHGGAFRRFVYFWRRLFAAFFAG